MNRGLFISLICWCALAVSCSKDDGNGHSTSKENTSDKVILVYMGGDNNLSTETSRKIEAIRQGYNSADGTLLIYQDAKDSNPKLLRIKSAKGSEAIVETIREYTEHNSASAEVFAGVLSEVKLNYPSTAYGLIVFSHATGWLPAGTLGNPNYLETRSVFMDGQHEMEISDFAAAIPDRMFDFIIFEACLMGGIEVAYELRNKTNYLLASTAEIVSPGFTPIYSAAVAGLFSGERTTADKLKIFGNAYMDYIEKNSANRSAMLSLVQTTGLESLAQVFAEMYRVKTVDDNQLTLSSFQRFDRPGSYGDSPALARFFDLEEVVENLAATTLTSRFSSQLANTVVWKRATEKFLYQQNGYEVLRHCGMSVYVEQDEFPVLNEAYAKTAWYQATR